MRSDITSCVSSRAATMRPDATRGMQTSGSRSSTKLATSIDSGPRAAHWHIRNSSACFRYLRPGASGHRSSISPDSSRALQVPQVPLPHS